LLTAAVALTLPPAAEAIVGGQVVPIQTVPWQAVVRTHFSQCGGAIVAPSEILTAAHCVTGASPASMTVFAGTSSNVTLSPTAQQVGVASIRVHPYFTSAGGGEGQPDDDVAVVTTATPLDLSGPAARPIGLATTEPTTGAVLGVSGYGRGASGQPEDGLLRAAQLSPVAFQSCPGFVDQHDAVLICVDNTPQAGTCQGDSGGPLTTGSPPLLVGLVTGAADFGPCDKTTGTFADLTAPEVRQFIDGNQAPPKAPRGHSGDVSPDYGVTAGQAISCGSGGWTGSPQFSYAFILADAIDLFVPHEPQVLQSGPSPRYVTTKRDAGHTLACVVTATNAGGTARDLTETTDIGSNRGRPRIRITSARCRRHRCTVRFAVREKRSVAGESSVVVRVGHKRLKVRRLGHGRYVATGRAGGGRVKVRAVSAASGRASTATRHV
jgi:trypsin